MIFGLFPLKWTISELILYFVSKIVLTYCEKKVFSSDREKLLKLEAEGQEFAKFLRFEIPRTIYSNSKSSIHI